MADRARLIRMIMIIAQEEVAEYQVNDGAYCPVCVKMGIQPPKAHVYNSNLPIRYHVCSICTHRFKSIQRDYEPVMPKPAPSKTPEKTSRKKKKSK